MDKWKFLCILICEKRTEWAKLGRLLPETANILSDSNEHAGICFAGTVSVYSPYCNVCVQGLGVWDSLISNHLHWVLCHIVLQFVCVFNGLHIYYADAGPSL